MFKAAIAALVAATIIPNAAVVSAAAPAATTTVGTKKALGAGRIWSWVRKSPDGATIAFGLSFDETALDRLGPEEAEIPLPLPPGAGIPFRTAVVDWNPHGHPPAHVYDVPHFDFHFYRIGEDERMAIGPTGPQAEATPSPSDVPGGFVTDGATIPMMGKHYVPAAAPEFRGGRFTATPIYGYYGGRMIFVESMVTVAYLKTRPHLSAPYAQPARVPVAGAYPTAWSVGYDAKAHRFDIAFDGLASRAVEVAR